MLRDHEDAKDALEEQCRHRVQKADEDRDLTLRRMQEHQEASVKSVCSQAAMAFISGKTKALEAICFHAWIRAAREARLEAKYEARLESAQEEQAQLAREWDEERKQHEADKARIENEFNSKIHQAEEERAEIMRRMEQESKEEKATRCNKAAMALIGNNARGHLKLTLAAWHRAVEHLVMERELEARLREVDDHKAQLIQQHDSEVGKLESKWRVQKSEHQAELRHLAEEESRKMGDVENEFNRLQDTLDQRIHAHEGEKTAILKAHDDERETLLKESKMMLMWSKDQGLTAHMLTCRKNQARLVILECFVAWSQSMTHSKWTKTVDDFYHSTGEEANRLCTRRENAASLLALRNNSRMAMFEVFKGWEQLALASRLHISYSEAGREVDKQRQAQKSQKMMFLISKDQKRLVLAQVFQVWLHLSHAENNIRQHERELKETHAIQRDNAKAFGFRFALKQLDSTNHLMGHQILSAWWLHAREAKWGNSLGNATRTCEGHRSREDIIIARSLLRFGKETTAQLAAIVFGVWKTSAHDAVSVYSLRAKRDKLLDRWGMQYGLKRGALFWHRVYAGWLRVAQLDASRRNSARQKRAHSLRVGECLAKAMGGAHYAFYRWQGNVSTGRSSAEATALSREVALLRLKHDKISCVFINLHFKSFIHTLLHEWWEYSHKSGWARLLDQANREVHGIRSKQQVTNTRLVMECWDSNRSVLIQGVLTAWRQRVLVVRSTFGTNHLRDVIASLRRKAGDIFRQRPLDLIRRYFGAWRHLATKSGGAKGLLRLKQASWALAQEAEDNQLFRTIFLMQGVFTRWKHWTLNVNHQAAVEELSRALQNSGGRGSVLALISTIQDQWMQLATWEVFTRWSLIVRKERPLDSVQVLEAKPLGMYYSNRTILQPASQQVYYRPAQVTASNALSAEEAYQSLRGTQSPGIPGAPSTFGWRFVNAEQQGLPTATIGVDVNRDGRADVVYTGVDMNRDGIPDFLQQGSVANVNVPTATVAVDANNDGVANYLYTGVDLNRDGIPDALQAGTETMGGLGMTVPRRPSVRRRDQASMSSTFSPQPAMALTCGPARSPSGSLIRPSLGMINRSPSGTVGTEQASVTVPTTIISPRATSPSFASAAAGYGLRLHTGAQRQGGAAAEVTASGAWESRTPQASFASGVTCSPALWPPMSPRPGATMAPLSPRRGSALAPTSPRQGAFSEIIPPHPSFGTAIPTMATVGAGSGIVIEAPRSHLGIGGPPTSLPGSVQSTHRLVSPMPSQE